MVLSYCTRKLIEAELTFSLTICYWPATLFKIVLVFPKRNFLNSVIYYFYISLMDCAVGTTTFMKGSLEIMIKK